MNKLYTSLVQAAVIAKLRDQCAAFPLTAKQSELLQNQRNSKIRFNHINAAILMQAAKFAGIVKFSGQYDKYSLIAMLEKDIVKTRKLDKVLRQRFSDVI